MADIFLVFTFFLILAFGGIIYYSNRALWKSIKFKPKPDTKPCCESEKTEEKTQ